MTDDDAATTFTNLPCTCGHTMADHQPIVTEDMPDDGCDLCDCASFTATPEPDDLCEMCGAPWHQDQAEQMDEYDLICPGVGGSWEDRQEYVYTRDQALLRKRRIEESPPLSAPTPKERDHRSPLRSYRPTAPLSQVR